MPRGVARSAALLLTAALPLAAQQRVKREPHIGYAYPAGGQQGTEVEILVGGQYLRAVKDVQVTGNGVTGEVVKVYRPMRNLMREQRLALQRRLQDLRDERIREMPPGPAKAALLKRSKWRRPPPKNEPEEAVELPEHHLLRELESKDLRQLARVANELLNPVLNRKRQPNSQLAEMALLRIDVAADAAPGNRELRLVSPLGVTNAIRFQVGTLPEIAESEPNDPGMMPNLPAIEPIGLPALVNGQVLPGDVDRIPFRAKRGDDLVIQVHARELIPYLADAVPGWFQATVAVLDGDGNEVAYADDFRFHPDPVLHLEVPADGVYELEIRDAIHRGREDFVYRVSIGELPFITSIFPLGGQAGKRTAATLSGWNLSRTRIALNTAPGGRDVRSVTSTSGGTPTNSVLYAVDTLPEAMDREPNNSLRSAQRVRLPLTINGRINTPGDVDTFRFHADRGDVVTVAVLGRRLGSPIDSLVRLLDARGRIIAWNDDDVLKEGHLHKSTDRLTHHADSALAAELPHGGNHYVQIADSQAQGGSDVTYRLRISPPRPDFELCVTPANLAVRSGQTVPLTIHALRRDGFEGPVVVETVDTDAGLVLSGNTIPKGRSEVQMTVTVPREMPGGTHSLKLRGRAHDGRSQIARNAIPAEDQMQAFLWRHLTPCEELAMHVRPQRWAPPTIAVAGDTPIRVPNGGTADVRLKAAGRRSARKVEIALVNAAEGLSVRDVRVLRAGVSFKLASARGSLEPGFADNLLIEVFTEMTPPKKNGKAAKPRRVSLGIVPAIPFEVVGR